MWTLQKIGKAEPMIEPKEQNIGYVYTSSSDRARVHTAVAHSYLLCLTVNMHANMGLT